MNLSVLRKLLFNIRNESSWSSKYNRSLQNALLNYCSQNMDKSKYDVVSG